MILDKFSLPLLYFLYIKVRGTAASCSKTLQQVYNKGAWTPILQSPCSLNWHAATLTSYYKCPSFSSTKPAHFSLSHIVSFPLRYYVTWQHPPPAAVWQTVEEFAGRGRSPPSAPGYAGGCHPWWGNGTSATWPLQTLKPQATQRPKHTISYTSGDHLTN